MDRREFLKTTAITAVAATVPTVLSARELPEQAIQESESIWERGAKVFEQAIMATCLW